MMTRATGWRRFLLVGLLLHIPFFAYPVLRLAGWLGLGWWLTILVFVPLFFGQIASRIYLRGRRAWWAVLLRRTADVWLGISPVMLTVLVAFEGIVLLTDLAEPTAALWVIGISLSLALIAVVNALVPTVKRVQLATAKLSRPLRFVQISDVHIGSRSQAFLERVVGRIRSLEPDFLCITGDFIDAPGIRRDMLEAITTIEAPIYFSIGNHERYEDLPRLQGVLEELGVQVLRNRAIRTGELQVIGIDDMDDELQVEQELSSISIDRNAYVILLFHRPRGLEAAAEAGVDLMLSGHTHGGQIIPFNLIVGRVFKWVKGLHRHGDCHLYVSTGTGTWGPVMRLGTRSEITLFEVAPVA